MVLSKDNPDTIDILAALLGKGGIAVLPGDTIYGLTGIAPDSESRLRSIKGREKGKPFLMLIGDPSWIKAFTDQALPPSLAPYWPGELTLLFRRRDGAGKAACRLPRDAWLAAVLERTGRPLYSTSVNRAGEKHLWRIDDIVKRFEAEVDAIVAAGDLPAAAPSTILDLTTRPYSVVRQGNLVIPRSIFEESR